jgi:hypothetical protein
VKSIALGFGIAAIAIGWMGCSSADGTPLGGPFGGTASTTPAAGTPSSTTLDGSASTEGGSSSDDAASVPDSNPPACTVSATAPTWSALYTNYFANGTVGNCAAVACHTEMPSAGVMYTWLGTQTKDCGPPNCLASIANATDSVLSWYGGGAMPVNGPLSEPQATCDLNAWAAAGAKNN